MVQNRLPHQLDRFLRRVIEFLFRRSTHDELRGGRIPDGRILARLPVPGSVLLPDVPTRFGPEPVMRSREDGPPFIPDDLLMVQETDPQQAIQNLAGELRSMPNIPHFETRNQS